MSSDEVRIRSLASHMRRGWLESIQHKMHDSLRAMEQAVANSWVSVEKEPGEGAPNAWGVWIRNTDVGEKQRAGQYGVLGTAAGLELMCSTCDFEDDITDDPRIELISGSWRYLQLTLTTKGGEIPDLRASLVVRQTQVIRALSALQLRLARLCQVDSTGKLFSPEANQALAGQILGELKEARVEKIKALSEPGRRNDHDLVGGYRFSSGSNAEPQTPIEWAYLLSSVLVALSRACLVRLLAPEQLSEYISKEDLFRLVEWVTDHADPLKSPSPEEFRVALFGGWSLLQFDELFGDIDRSGVRNIHARYSEEILDVETSELAVKGERRRRLQRALRRGAKEVITDGDRQSDLHHPYTFCFDEESPYDADSYRQDHLVVPTVPVALWLIARLDSKALFDPRTEDLAVRVASCFKDHHSPGVAPGQSSTYNGTVNMNYLHDAVDAVEQRSARGAQDRRSWRWSAAVTSPRPRWEKMVRSQPVALALAVFLFIISPLTALFWTELGLIGDESQPAVSSEAKGSFTGSGVTVTRGHGEMTIRVPESSAGRAQMKGRHEVRLPAEP